MVQKMVSKLLLGEGELPRGGVLDLNNPVMGSKRWESLETDWISLHVNTPEIQEFHTHILSQTST